MAKNIYDEYDDHPLPGMSAERPAVPAPVDVTTRQQGEPPDLSELGLSLPQGGDSGAVGRVVQAAAEGWRGGTMQTPQARAKNEETLLGHFLINPLIEFGNLPLRAAGALGAGAGQAAYEGGAALGGPALGRDLFMLNQLTPAFGMPGSVHPPLAEAPRGPPPGGRFASERVAPPRTPGMTNAERMQQLIQHDIVETNPAPSFVPPGTPRPDMPAVPTNDILRSDPSQVPPRPSEIPPTTTKDPVTGEVKPIQQPQPGEQAAGAQVTPAGQATITPEQAAAYGSTADKQWLYKSVPPGEINDVERIPGIKPTLAQREQTAVRARETKAVRNLSKEADQAERVLLDEHNTKRKEFFQQTAGSDVTQDIAIESANKNIENGLAAAFRGGGQVDPGGIIAAIQAERDAPSGKLPPVKAVMNEIEKALQKSDGSGLETDPRQVYGVRRVINYLQSKRGLVENPGYGDRDVQAALIRVKAAIDGSMEPAAPGFGKAISDFAEAQRAIEAREALQAKEPKLYDDKGRMQFSKLHAFMNEVIQSRDPRAPLNPYQSLTEAQMNRLKSLHDDLMYVSSAEDLAKARGSDTAPNILDAVKQAAQGLPGTIAAGVVGHTVGGPVGAVIAPMAKGYVESVFSRRAERAATRRMEEMLRPNPQLYPTRQNPLRP